MPGLGQGQGQVEDKGHDQKHLVNGRMVVMLGRLHAEIALWKMVGDLRDVIGWSEASIASAGTADSFMHASPLTRSLISDGFQMASVYAHLYTQDTSSIPVPGTKF